MAVILLHQLLLLLLGIIQLLLVAVAAAAAATAEPAAAARLRLEYMEEPAGVDVRLPRFTWALSHPERGQAQTAYQIVVAVVTDGVGRAAADGVAAAATTPNIVWDSGKTVSNASQNILYAGQPLRPDTPYSWAVRWWDAHGTAAPPSAPARFSTGLYQPTDWEGAAWIGGSRGKYRREFAAKSSVRRATVYVVGLGYYKLWVNGQKVSSHELGPFTTFAERCYYDTWDVTAQLNAVVGAGGTAHALGVFLGDGWFSQLSLGPLGPPRLLLRLSIVYSDGSAESIVSSATASDNWTFTGGPVTAVDIYAGETYNSSLETPGWTTANYNEGKGSAGGGGGGVWVPAQSSVAPSEHVRLTSHAVLPPIRIGESRAPIALWESGLGEWVFDFGQNGAGFSSLFVPAGLSTVPNVAISMLHAEAIHGPPENRSKIYHHYSCRPDGRCPNETNIYITRGDGQAINYTPLFTYAGFRYARLTGYPGVPTFKTLTAHFVHTDFEMTGSIGFSDPDLTAVQHITRASALSNFQSIPTDCPQRERRVSGFGRARACPSLSRSFSSELEKLAPPGHSPALWPLWRA
jgi:alpha-L-rhamnosidase